MLHPAIDDMRFFDPLLEGVGTTDHLGNHAAGDGFLFDKAVQFGYRYTFQQSAAFVLHTIDIGQQDQLFSFEGSRNPAGHQVGIDVVAFSIRPDTDRRDNRNIFPLLQSGDQIGVDLDHIADIADIDHLDRAVFPLDLLQQLLRLQQGAVPAGETDRPPAMLVEVSDDLLVNLTRQHHFNDLHRFGVGYPHAAHELGDDTITLQGVIDLRAAAMNDNGVDPQ